MPIVRFTHRAIVLHEHRFRCLCLMRVVHATAHNSGVLRFDFGEGWYTFIQRSQTLEDSVFLPVAYLEFLKGRDYSFALIKFCYTVINCCL